MSDKILVVDDDDYVLDCFQRVLSRHFSLDTAPGAVEALHAVATKGPYAVIVSDMRMPGMDGIQFLLKVKELAPYTVAILLSGNLDPVELSPIPPGLVFKTLEKPLPFGQLVEFVKEALAQYHSRQEGIPGMKNER